eukprot:TRINITY_DN41981_c0_g1_i1.p1 TRINITY_DN41981_c0_g1~~TRINITY_DN41981_c0_g1_i1.p1  ORF type:complete len:424 (+),score=73.54 TRINITY_DN41981_c0_g1_i1:96-1367(+)
MGKAEHATSKVARGFVAHALLVSWRVPLQAARLSIFFLRFGLWIALLLPGLVLGFCYWAFAGKHVLRARYREKGSMRHTCDIYLPAASATALASGQQPLASAPVMILVAGGAWIVGHKGYMAMMGRALRSAGILCVAVDYRSWPQVGIDEMAEDVDAAIKWTLGNCAHYGGNPMHVSVAGLSSGAHILALVLARRAAEDLQSEPERCAGPPRAAQSGHWKCADLRGFVGLGGVYDLSSKFMKHLHRKGIDFLMQQWIFGEAEVVRNIRSPTFLVRSQPQIAEHLPPVLLLHGTEDKISPPDQSEAFCASLRAGGAKDVSISFCKGGGHNDPVVHSPMMSENSTYRAIILNVWRWGPDGECISPKTKQNRLDAAIAEKEQTSMNCASSWEDAAELACSKQLSLLPSWPRCPVAVIHAARSLTPF